MLSAPKDRVRALIFHGMIYTYHLNLFLHLQLLFLFTGVVEWANIDLRLLINLEQ